MNIKQQAHTKMFIAVLGVLDSFKTIWTAVTAFVTARNALASAIDDIRAEELKQSGTTTGITQNKRLARQAMCSAAAVVGGAVAQWAETQGKNDLFTTVDFSNADLLHMTEADCLTNCTAIYNAGNANIAALTTAGTLAAADLTDLNTKIGAFNALIAAPRLAKTGTSAATNLLPDKVDAGDRICERQLDRLMERYKDSNADFYRAYQSARIIVDAGGGSGNGGTPPPTTPPTTPHP
jgi:hypothetical protein